MHLQRDLMKAGVYWYGRGGWIVSEVCHRFPLHINLSSINHHYPPYPSSSVFQQNQLLPCLGVLDISAMFTSNGVAKNSGKGKRKMREYSPEPPSAAGHHQTNLFNLHGQHFASPSVPLDGHLSQVQQILNTAAPLKPFSFMSLLTADDEDDRDPLLKDIKDQREQINQMIFLHSENLRQALGGLLEKHHRNLHHEADERATKRLKERELELEGKLARYAELERLLELYKGEAERLLIRVRSLEQMTTSLRERLHEANSGRPYAETAQEEEAESSFADPDRLEPVMLDCKVCEKQLATVMVWPCRHVCVCLRCEAITKYCPVCHLIKTTSIEVHLPNY